MRREQRALNHATLSQWIRCGSLFDNLDYNHKRLRSNFVSRLSKVARLEIECAEKEWKSMFAACRFKSREEWNATAAAGIVVMVACQIAHSKYYLMLALRRHRDNQSYII